jgi:4-carboxymuconolactone decarboxylase
MTSQSDGVQDARKRRTEGIAAYASQFGIAPEEVERFFYDNYGEEFAESSFRASGGATWKENNLSLRERSLIVLSALTALGGVDDRLRGHIKWALTHELTEEDLESTFVLLANYVGFARASIAMDILKKK